MQANVFSFKNPNIVVVVGALQFKSKNCSEIDLSSIYSIHMILFFIKKAK